MLFKIGPATLSAGILLLSGISVSTAQTDPGVRPGAINGQTGATQFQPLPVASVVTPATGDPTNAIDFFNDGLLRFQQSKQNVNGQGPRFNANQCGGCHAQPTLGGTSTASNLQAFAVFSPEDVLPSFITATGPVREARFPFFFNADGSVNTSAPNGGVETLFTISGTGGALNCHIAQPNFAAAVAANNVVFRIPTPLFGAGLLENLDDSTLIAVRVAAQGNGMGISGTFNHNGNDGTIARFGWKAQNKSLLMFAGEAYNVEMGISNQLFPQERDETPNCQGGVAVPNDTVNFPAISTASSAMSVLSDVEAFATFMRLLAPPAPGPATASTGRGSALFSSIGCNLCHTPAFTTATAVASGSAHAPSAALSGQAVRLFSDLLLHHMGVALADGISQGAAGPDEFRTAPLWGLGQRIFFLHDGRTQDLVQAIRAHSSSGSEASQVVQNFAALTQQQQQDLLNFLRSL